MGGNALESEAIAASRGFGLHNSHVVLRHPLPCHHHPNKRFQIGLKRFLASFWDGGRIEGGILEAYDTKVLLGMRLVLKGAGLYTLEAIYRRVA